MRKFLAVVAAIVGLLGTTTFAQEQHAPLSQVLPNLVLRDIVLQPGTVGPPHVAHFSPLTNDLNNPVVSIVESFNGQMATQFATFPLGSSAGGLTYEFDPSVGTFRRGSSSFGPLFSERALTIGRRKLSVGFNYQHTSYDTFEGQNLNDGSIKFYLRHQDCCHFADPAAGTGFTTTPLNGHDTLNPPFKGDIIQAALSLKATTDTAAVFANYGVTDRWDVGLAAPFVRVNLDATVTATIIRLVTCPDPTIPAQCFPTTHAFDYNHPFAPLILHQSGHAAGVGDLVLRTKYQFLRRGNGGLAAAVDLRLPTGNKDELLGAGGVQGKFLLIASSEHDRFGQHVNIGYTMAGGRVGGTFAGLTSAPLPDEINYTGGGEFLATRRLTVVGDVIGRTLRGAGRLDLVSQGFEYNELTSLIPGRTPGPGCGGFPGFTCKTAFFNEFNPRPGNLRLLLGAAGVKYNLVGNLLVSASVLLPLTNAGLRSRVTTMVGMDYVVK
ncbi:MAG TPA: transporter [Bryobacterales bacterium]|nr:transporter [Bryobacterales bacterium]